MIIIAIACVHRGNLAVLQHLALLRGQVAEVKRNGSGRSLDAERFTNKRSLDLMPYGKCDWVTGTQTEPIIHEGSRSKHHSEPKRAQLQHYLWAAKQLYGLDATGELHLQKGPVERVEPDHAAVERDHARLRGLTNKPMPKPERIPICKGCTNRDWCWE